MLRKLSDVQLHDTTTRTRRARTDMSFHATLWTIWTLVLVGYAYTQWHADVAAARPVDMIGLVLHTLLAGVVGLIIMTRIEMWIDPERFIAGEPRKR